MSRRRISDESPAPSRAASARGSNSTASRRVTSQRGLAQNRRPARVATPDDEDEVLPDEEEDGGQDSSGEVEDGRAKSNKKGLAKEDLDRLVKNFVRYALACEYTRTPLRRDEVSKKVLEGKYSRAFGEVFDQTQARLESVFRMRLVELPAKEKHQTIQQQRRNPQSKSAPPIKSWILISTLPDEIRNLPDVTKNDDENDAIYQGIVTVIVSLVKLNNSILPEESLNRYLKYLSIEENTPIMTTEKFLTTMVKQGYIEKVKDMSSGEPRFDYHLGPRGKVEVGKKGTLDFLKEIYGDEWSEELEKRVERSMDELKATSPQDDDEAPPRKRPRVESDDEERPRGGARSQRRPERDGLEAENSRAGASRRRQQIESEEEDAEEEEDQEEEEDEEEEEAPRSRRQRNDRGKAPVRGYSRGRPRGRGRGSARGRRNS